MKEIVKSIGILFGLIFLSNFVGVLPDYVDGQSTSFGAVGGNLFYVLFCFVPIIIFILLDLDIIDVYSLPFSDILDQCMDFVLYLSVLISSFIFPYTGSALTNAVSFIMTVFIVLFPLYLFYTDIVRIKLRVENKFVNRYLPSVVFGGLIVLSIVLAYALGPQGIYLPGDLSLSFGTYTVMGIAIPNLYFLSVGGIVLYFVYSLISYRVIPMFIPSQSYNYTGNARSSKHR